MEAYFKTRSYTGAILNMLLYNKFSIEMLLVVDSGIAG